MSPVNASGGASALKGWRWIIVSAERACRRLSSASIVGSSSITVVDHLSRQGGSSVVRVLEVRVTVLVEGTDPFHAIWVHGGAPMGLHHDGDRLLDRLPLTHLDSALDRLHRSRRLVGDLLCYGERRRHQLLLGVNLVDHPHPTSLLRCDRVSGHQHLKGSTPWQQARKGAGRAATGRKPDHRLRLSEGCVLRRDDEVGALGYLRPAAVRDSVHHGEDRLSAAPERVEGAIEFLTLSQPLLLGHA